MFQVLNVLDNVTILWSKTDGEMITTKSELANLGNGFLRLKIINASRGKKHVGIARALKIRLDMIAADELNWGCWIPRRYLKI